MRYIIRKFVDAETVQEALSKEPTTPVQDCYLKEGEQPKTPSGGSVHAVGFIHPEDATFGFSDEPRMRR